MAIDRAETRTIVAPDRCAALLAAVRAHDTVDLSAVLPQRVDLDFGPGQFARFFALAHALWAEGTDRRSIARIAAAALPGRRLADADAAAFKDMRARFKQLRFAHVMFDRDHDYPARIDRMTRTMGHLQDAIRHGRRGRAMLQALALRLLAARGPYAAMVRSLDRFEPSDAASFHRYLAGEMAAIRTTLATPEITAARFHATRKIVSRLVAMYDCVDTLEPSPHHHAIVCYLSTINGLMGGLHDEMVARRLTGAQDYRAARFVLPDAVAMRLRRLEQVFSAALPEPA